MNMPDPNTPTTALHVVALVKALRAERDPQYQRHIEEGPLGTLLAAVPMLISTWRDWLGAEAVGDESASDKCIDELHFFLQAMSDCCSAKDEEAEWFKDELHRLDLWAAAAELDRRRGVS